jgi:hypothetical protein
MNYLLSEGKAGQALELGNRAAATHVADWKAQMITTYQRHRQGEDSTLRIALARRLRTLIGVEVNRDDIWVDLDEHSALVTVDGIRFRSEQSQLVMLRPCTLCDSGQFASPPLASQADVGYALSAWQPRHPQCRPDDPVSW